MVVEGISDREIFQEWYRDVRDRLEFYACDEASGDEGVEKLLSLLHESTNNAFGIVDRDFRPDEAVEKCYSDPDVRLFILRRYAIENYLLEPAAIREELRLYYGPKHTVPTSAQVSTRMLALWPGAHDDNGVELGHADADCGPYFAEGHDLIDRITIVQVVSKRLGSSPE